MSSFSPKPGHFIIFVVLAVASVGISFVIAQGGITIGVAVIALIVAIPIVVLMLINLKFGFYLILIASFLIYYINRMTEQLVPVIVIEILMWLVFAGFTIRQIRTHNIGGGWKVLRNPITIALLIWTVYLHLQLFNPNSSSLMGKLILIRLGWFSLVAYVVAWQVFDSFAEVKLFFKVLLAASLVAALYGISQSYIGLLPYEQNWLFSDPERVNTWFVAGRLRVWSFSNDPTNFGLLMAFSGLICFMLALGPFGTKRRIGLGVCGLLMFLAMVGSGTRTSFVMVVVGFVIFGMLTIDSIRTILFIAFAVGVFLVIFFGPFYSAPVERIRSAFIGNEDASLNVRSENKKRIRPYIYEHPFGGGPATSGEPGKLLAPGHPLAGFPPDSEYLKDALELGFIGLLLALWLQFTATRVGVHQYFQSNNPEMKIFYTAILASFMALCTANLTQLATSMKPYDLITVSYFAILIRFKEFESKQGPPAETAD